MAFNSPTAQNVFNYDKDALFGQFGMDWKGDNESGKWARGNQQITGVGFTNANDYAVNTLEPARQNSLNYMIGQTQPGNVQANTRRVANEINSRGQQIGGQQAMAAEAKGYSPEYAQAIRTLLANKAQRQANAYAGDENDRMLQNQIGALKMIGENQQNPFLQQFMALAQLIEGRSETNKRDKAQGGLGGILPLISGIAGMDWASMLGGGGGNTNGLTAPDASNPFWR